MPNLLSTILEHPLIAHRPHLRQFLKFSVVGVISTLLDYGVFALLSSLIHVPYLLANILSFSLAVMNSYYLNRRWTYRSQHPNWKGEGLKYLIVYIIGLGISEFILFVLVDRWQIHQLLAKAVSVCLVIFWNYSGTRFWAFRHQRLDLPG